MFLAPVMAVLGWTALATDPVAAGTVLVVHPMFPDGFEHDFGKVPSGVQARHVFRIVNTSKVPLEIVSLRCGG